MGRAVERGVHPAGLVDAQAGQRRAVASVISRLPRDRAGPGGCPQGGGPLSGRSLSPGPPPACVPVARPRRRRARPGRPAQGTCRYHARSRANLVVIQRRGTFLAAWKHSSIAHLARRPGQAGRRRAPGRPARVIPRLAAGGRAADQHVPVPAQATDAPGHTAARPSIPARRQPAAPRAGPRFRFRLTQARVMARPSELSNCGRRAVPRGARLRPGRTSTTSLSGCRFFGRTAVTQEEERAR